MSTTGDTNMGSALQNAAAQNPWTQRLPYLYSLTLPDLAVCQSIHDGETTKTATVLLVTRSDGVHKIGELPDEQRDTRLEDGSEARKAYLCKLGSVLASKLGISSGGNKPDDVLWDVVPEMLFGYELFERRRLVVTTSRASDIYVVGHPIHDGSYQSFFRTAEEFAEHLRWLAEGDEDKQCKCVLCPKEAKRLGTNDRDRRDFWRDRCHARAQSYMGSTSLVSVWGDLPAINE